MLIEDALLILLAGGCDPLPAEIQEMISDLPEMQGEAIIFVDE